VPVSSRSATRRSVHLPGAVLSRLILTTWMVAGCGVEVGHEAPCNAGAGGEASGSTGGAHGTDDGSSAGGSASRGTPGDAASDGSATGSGGASGGAENDASTSSGGTAGAGGATSAACSDGTKDGDETDVDCGGSCGPCGLGQGCIRSSDCSATAAGCDDTLGGCACDALSHVCVASHCVDHALDGAESAVDCGGLCDGCGPGEACQADTDCSVYAAGCERCMCDRDTSTCVHDHCLDHKLDVDETDVDCGGSKCLPCANGELCRLDSDCVTNACDLLTHRCITDQCADHRQDGKESDADCGGGVCAVCQPGKHCFISADCTSAHYCLGGICR